MQEFPSEAVMAGSISNVVGPGIVSAPVTEPVSVPVPTPVSISPQPAVSIPVPAPQVIAAPVAPVVRAETVPAVTVPVAKAPEPVVPPPVVPVVVAVPVQAVTPPPVAPQPAAPEVALVKPVEVVAEKPVVVQDLAPAAGAGRRTVPVPAEPTIQPDSVLWVTVSEDPSLNGRYLVNDASAIDFGYVGLVFLNDMSVLQAEAELKRVLEGRYLKTAAVSVRLMKASYDKVGVQGMVEMPGDIKIGPGAAIPLGEALRRAGGLRGNRENSRVKIIRGGLKTPFGPAAIGDVYSLVTQDGQLKVPDVFLRNDDLAYVFTPSTESPQGQAVGVTGATGAGGKRVVLLGEVPRRGVVEFSENEPCTLMYLLFKVGGLPRFAKANKITVVRRNKDGSEQKFLVDGEKLMNTGKPEDDLVLETGDRIVVPARKISFF